MNAFFAAFAIVFLRGLQTQNVTHLHYVAAALTSFCMAVAEVAVLLVVIDKGWPAVPYIGAGGAIGVTTAMLVHSKWIR